MVLLEHVETRLSSGCSETMLTSEQPLRRLYLSASLVFLYFHLALFDRLVL